MQCCCFQAVSGANDMTVAIAHGQQLMQGPSSWAPMSTYSESMSSNLCAAVKLTGVLPACLWSGGQQLICPLQQLASNHRIHQEPGLRWSQSCTLALTWPIAVFR